MLSQGTLHHEFGQRLVGSVRRCSEDNRSTVVIELPDLARISLERLSVDRLAMNRWEGELRARVWSSMHRDTVLPHNTHGVARDSASCERHRPDYHAVQKERH